MCVCVCVNGVCAHLMANITVQLGLAGTTVSKPSGFAAARDDADSSGDNLNSLRRANHLSSDLTVPVRSPPPA